jgi:cystathionine beta-lyase/cystathionine gamma-synthase
MTHAPVSEKALAAAGIGQNLIRLSIGLESTEDLAADLLEALDAASKAVVLTPVAVAR